MNSQRIRLAVGSLLIAANLSSLWAGSINLPNASFESPVTAFVTINFDAWQKTDKPEGYDESGGFLWTQLVGAFKNTALGSADHIHNCDGGQAIWLFAVPQTGLFQDYDSKAWNDSLPSHSFNAIFEAGKSYQLTVGVIGGGGGMLEGATMEIALYYRDAASNMVTVAATSVTNSLLLFPTTTNFVDIQARVPTVKPSDPWSGRHLGVRMFSTVSAEVQGGYWDLDNVRLSSICDLQLHSPMVTNGQFNLLLQSEPGTRFELLHSANLSMPMSNWSRLGTVTNSSGSVIFTDPLTNTNRRFYGARQLP
ncbi:MAG: hypothetical protein WCO56_07055 [Verrucomicrobiota bacterium]